MMNIINRRKFLTLTAFGTASLAVYGKNPSLVLEENPEHKEIYHFKIGEFNCISFNTGYHDYPVSGFFNNISADQIQMELGLSEPPETIKSAYACIFVDTGINRILIDSGIGAYFEGSCRLQKYLRQENIPNESIDTIIITHAHADHYSGLADNEGNLLFPNASYYSRKIEWDFFYNEEDYKKFKEDNKNFCNRIVPAAIKMHEMIKDKLIYTEPNVEVIPGITAIDAKGHTPGQLAVLVSSEGDKLIYISDTVFHPLHLKHPDWLPHPMYMVNPEEYKKTKRRILDMAADQNMLVSAMHFYPPPGLGYVKRTEEGWEWHPIN
jgi:glyoxylase-like metal-dependent hydrolase (beta-lactamase superfamily II)